MRLQLILVICLCLLLGLGSERLVQGMFKCLDNLYAAATIIPGFVIRQS